MVHYYLFGVFHLSKPSFFKWEGGDKIQNTKDPIEGGITWLNLNFFFFIP